jgi:GT2 family glycosyltransferase
MLARCTGLHRGKAFLLLFGIFGTMLYCPAVLFRKEFFDGIGGFNSEFAYCVDFEMWVRAIRKGGRYFYLPKPLYRYRISNASTAHRERFETKYYLEEFRAYHLPWNGNRFLSLLSVPALTAVFLEDLLPLKKETAQSFTHEVIAQLKSAGWSNWLRFVSFVVLELKR